MAGSGRVRYSWLAAGAALPPPASRAARCAALCRPPLAPLLAQATAKHPRKAMYRARAHSNPFNDPIYDVPPHPDDMDWCAAAAAAAARLQLPAALGHSRDCQLLYLGTAVLLLLE